VTSAVWGMLYASAENPTLVAKKMIPKLSDNKTRVLNWLYNRFDMLQSSVILN
jgi:hypothetical protein